MHSQEAARYLISRSSDSLNRTIPMLRQFASRFKSFRSHRADIRQLEQMNDRELADIGIDRGDIASVVRFGRR